MVSARAKVNYTNVLKGLKQGGRKGGRKGRGKKGGREEGQKGKFTLAARIFLKLSVVLPHPHPSYESGFPLRQTTVSSIKVPHSTEMDFGR